MKCECCENPAVIHATEIVSGAPREHHYCAEHAERHLGEHFARVSSLSRLDAAAIARLAAEMEEAGVPGKPYWRCVTPQLLVPELVKALSHPEPDLRYLAAVWLGGFGPDAKEAIPQLRVALDDENEDVRRAAKDALRRIERPPTAT